MSGGRRATWGTFSALRSRPRVAAEMLNNRGLTPISQFLRNFSENRQWLFPSTLLSCSAAVPSAQSAPIRVRKSTSLALPGSFRAAPTEKPTPLRGCFLRLRVSAFQAVSVERLSNPERLITRHSSLLPRPDPQRKQRIEDEPPREIVDAVA